MRSVGAAGSPYAAFRRALQARNATLALAEARDMPRLGLPDMLELVVLVAEQRPELYQRAAVRFAGRYLLDRPRVRLTEAALVLALLDDVGEYGDGTAATCLRELVGTRV